MESERIIHVQRRLRLSPRTCATCGTTFAGWGRQRFCSPACRRRKDYEVHAEARKQARRDYYERQKAQRGQP